MCNKCKCLLKYENLNDHLTNNHKIMEFDTNSSVNSIQSEKEINSQSIQKANDMEDQLDVCKFVVSQKILEEHINEKNQENFNELSPKLTDEADENQVQCKVCIVVVSRNDLQEHINEREHQTTLYQIIMKQSKRSDRKQVDHCDICNDAFKYRTLQEHIQDQVHLKNLMNIDLDLLKSINDKVIGAASKIKRNSMKEIAISTNLKLSNLNLSEYFTDFYMLQLSKNVPRPLSLQKISSNHFRCLVCKTMFIEGTSLKLHVSSEIHQRNYNNEEIQLALKIYHTIWRTLPDKIEPHEIFFFPHTICEVFCQLCLVPVENSKIKKHCKHEIHVREAVDGNLWREIDESLYHEKSDRIEKGILSERSNYKKGNVFHRTEQFYSDDLLQKLDNKSHRFEKTILMSSPGVYNCLLCRKKNITGPLLEIHCSSITHRVSMESRFQNNLVRQFHYDWSNIPVDFQLHQIYFLPNYTTYSCLLCSSNHISPGSILSHVCGSKHAKNFKRLHPDAIPKCFDLIDEPTEMKLHPENLTAMLNYITDNPDDYILIQKLSSFEVKCLVCKTKFENIPSHLLSKKHKKRMQHRENVKAMKKYIAEWKKIPENLNIQQLFYEPYDEEHIMCNKCNDFLKYENLHDHLTNAHKLIEVQTPNIQLNSIKLEQKCTNSPQISIPECKFAPSTYYPIHFLQKMRKLEGKIYRNVQMISESNYRCLLCKMFVENLDEHISTSDHLKLLSDKKLISYVEKFHNSWAITDNYLQFQQMYFFPSNESMISCVLCLEDINYKNLISHLQINQHHLIEIEKFNSSKSFKSSDPNSNTSTANSSSVTSNKTYCTNFDEDEDTARGSSRIFSDESDTE